MNIREVLVVAMPFGLSMVLCACAGQQTFESDLDPAYSHNEMVISGRLEQAMYETPGLDLFDRRDRRAIKRWEEQLDQGDDPFTPGCACLRQLPGCGGRTVGRAVDECFPHDGVSLHEKTITRACDTYSGKTYDCEDLLGKGATCRLQPLTCCGVETASAYCYIDLEE